MHKALKTVIRSHYRTLQGYVSAGMESNKTADKVFMNANENPFELPELAGLNRYPEPQPGALLEAYAGLYGVKPANIVATRGADEALVILTKLFCEPHEDSALICPPTFGMYGVDARAMPADVVEVPLIKKGGTFRLDVEGIIQTLSLDPVRANPAPAAQDANGMTGQIKIIFICSPNNPTGTSFAREDILQICKAAEGRAAVILDETYIEFAKAESLVPALGNHPNLIILRTLSKSYGLAGARMGCLLSGDADFIHLIRSKCLDAYPLPKPSIEAALKVMQPDNLKRAAENRALLRAERDRLITALKELDYVNYIYPSDANFIFVEMKRPQEMLDYCAAHNFILRDFTDKPGTKNCLRLSPDRPENNDRLIELLKTF